MMSRFIALPKDGQLALLTMSSPLKLIVRQHKVVAINCLEDPIIDYIKTIKKGNAIVNTISAEGIQLASPNVHPSVVKLYSYLKSIYGKNILAGQQAQYDDDAELQVILKETGKEPAVRGFDFMDYSPSRVARGAVCQDVDVAIDWWKSGGIVTFCWHWNAPMDLIDTIEKPWHSGFYTNASQFDLEKALANKESERYKAIISDIDVIAGQLKILEGWGVPVLWRPLHEASGGWFWWGAKGGEPCKALWIIIYDRLINVHGLTNLIWVWNGQHQDWYPGDEYVDIIGEDIYPSEKDYSPQQGKFQEARGYSQTGDKMIALTENGVIPDPDQMIKENITWLWFCTWRGEFVMDKNHNYSEKYTEKDQLIKTYQHEFVITKDELPDFSI